MSTPTTIWTRLFLVGAIIFLCIELVMVHREIAELKDRYRRDIYQLKWDKLMEKIDEVP